jgi:Kef-type K+ transport system membrane component KefB
MTGPAHVALFFIQVACILAACRGVGWIAARVGQPRVVAEMVTGFLLGPSFLGWIVPSAYQVLFPADSLSVLSLVSQIGLVLYMFCVGLEFRSDLVIHAGRRAAALSIGGIAGPFALGGLLTLYLLTTSGLFSDRVTPVQSWLFIGTALSITAFPVLARIIGEHGISGTTIGSLALSAGAIDDAAAWMLLAGVLGTLSGRAEPAIVAVGGGIGYAVLVLAVVPRVLERWRPGDARREGVSAPELAAVVSVLMLGAWFTETIGIHAIFGAFLFGVSFRRGQLALELRRLIEPLASALFVPLFFAYAGLHTEIALLSSLGLWIVAALVFATACCGKGLACSLAAYWAGSSKREALALATLMNARGMVELILIDIGLSRGIITPTLYTMLVLMAIGTTIMTGPLFGFIWQRSKSPFADAKTLGVRELR